MKFDVFCTIYIAFHLFYPSILTICKCQTQSIICIICGLGFLLSQSIMSKITIEQEYQVQELQKIVISMKYKSDQERKDRLSELGYKVQYKRVYKSGGVGSYMLMKRLECYRMVVCATVWGKSSSRMFLCYAWCVEV